MINLKEISGKALFGLSVLHGFLYTLFILLIPCSIVMVKYDLFVQVEAGRRLTAIGLIVLMGFLFVGLGLLKRQVKAIPVDAEGWKSVCRALLDLIYAILLPVIILFIVYFIRDNMILATNVIQLCIISIIIGAVENCILGSSIQRENAIRTNSSRNKQADSRSSKV